MPKRLWCGIYAVSVLLLIILMIAAAVVGMLTADEVLQPGYLGAAISLLVLGYLQFVVFHTVATLVLLFKMWKALEDGVTPVTAGKAIGFLFIPFFNIYWFFRVWGGYPSEYNKFLERHRLNAPPLGSGIFIAFAVTVGLSAVLLIPILILPFVTIFLIARGWDAIANLELAKSAAGLRALSPSDFIGTPENPRSKVPVFALAGVAAFGVLAVAGFGVFTWLNLNPKASPDVLPEAVGDFKLERPGRVEGSFFGGKLSSMDNIYVSETAGSREAIRYNFAQYSSESRAIERVTSFCSSPTSITVIKDQEGKEAGRFCIDSGSVSMQVGRYYLWAHGVRRSEVAKAEAKEAPLDSVVTFTKALPLAKGLSFPDTNISASPSTASNDKQTTSVVLSSTTPADFSMTAKEFYDETNSSSAAAKAKYKGKTVQVSSRVEVSSGSSLMMSAGKNSLFANYDPSQSSAFSKLERDERVAIKCVVEAEYSIRLNSCVLVENKGIISPTDTPDVTFTAEEYWKAVASFDIPVAAKMKKQDELKGKIIQITGRVKDLAGTKYYLDAGNDNEFPCYPDDANKPDFSSLTEGQSVTFLAVGGTSLSHCLVTSK